MPRIFKLRTLVTICLLALSGLGFSLMLAGGSSASATVLYENMPAQDKPLRLHILANSDDAFDQQLKLAVRDQIIGRMEEILNGADDKEEAMELLAAALPELKAEIDAYLDDYVDYTATLAIERDDFPAINYDGATFASGEYDALRIVLGQGAGHNWWCVLFPPLCFVDLAAEKDQQAVVETMAGGNDSTPGYRVELKLLQLLGGQ